MSYAGLNWLGLHPNTQVPNDGYSRLIHPWRHLKLSFQAIDKLRGGAHPVLHSIVIPTSSLLIGKGSRRKKKHGREKSGEREGQRLAHRQVRRAPV